MASSRKQAVEAFCISAVQKVAKYLYATSDHVTKVD